MRVTGELSASAFLFSLSPSQLFRTSESFTGLSYNKVGTMLMGVTVVIALKTTDAVFTSSQWGSLVQSHKQEELQMAHVLVATH